MLYIILEGLIVFLITYVFFKVTVYTPINPKHRNDSAFYALFMLGVKWYIALCAALVFLNKCKDILYGIRFINSPADDYFAIWLNSILK